MPFALAVYSQSQNRRVAVSTEERDAVARAMEGLLRTLAVEEKFDMLAENFDELEGTLDTISRRSILFARKTWDSMVADIHTVNRRLSNFLSTARLYIDQVDHDLGVVFGTESPARAAFNERRSREYEGRLGYRTLEALRNYAQHRDTPVHGIVYGRQAQGEGDDRKVINTLRATIDVKRLRSEGSFKVAVLEELERLEVEPNVQVLAREYMTGLQGVHTVARAALMEAEGRWRMDLRSVADNVKEELADPGAEINELLTVSEEGNVADRRAVFDHFLPRLEELRAKNACRKDLTKQLRSG
jgi:hypothetical protein